MTRRTHTFTARLTWDGNTGKGTAHYAGYERRYRVQVAGKPDLAGSADPVFRGEAGRHTPEDHFLAAIAGCHMLSYLALCARRGVCVVGYEDQATGRLVIDANGGGRFEEVTLRPSVLVEDERHVELAAAAHDTAHALCFIANSCGVPIRHVATVRVRRAASRNPAKGES